MVVYALADEEKYSYFPSDHYKFTQNERLEEGSLLKSTNESVDPYDHHIT